MDEPEVPRDAGDEDTSVHLVLVQAWAAKCVGDDRLFRHVDSKKVHRGNPSMANFTACSYYVSLSFEQLTVNTEADVLETMVLCKRCFGKDGELAQERLTAMSQPLISALVG